MEKIKQFFKKDKFAEYAGIELDGQDLKWK
jgi:hypothetical protein